MNIFKLSFFVVLAIFLVSCGGKKDSAEGIDDEFTAFPLPGLEKEEWILDGKAFGIFHEVKEFENWKVVFDQDEPRREMAGFQFLSILRSAEDSNSIAVFFMTPDHQAAKDFISEGLRSKMDEAGVTSLPSFIMYDIVYLTNKNYNSIPYRIAVSYKVKNFKSWLEKYNADLVNRNKAGMTEIGVARSPESHRLVYMMVAANTEEEARVFIEKEMAPEKMSEYGVVGDPTFSLWKRADYVD